MVILYGGTGFIGRHICEQAYHQKTNIAVISRKPDTEFLASLDADIPSACVNTKEADGLLSKASTVVYLANSSKPGTSSKNLAEILTDDLHSLTLFTEKLYTLQPKCKLIYLSSGGQIYGPAHTSPIPELSQEKPTTPYALSKHLNEVFLSYFTAKHNLPVLILRLANPIGHWQIGTSHGFVSAAIQAAMTRKTLTIFGEGENSRDYFDVEDFAKLIFDISSRSDFPQGTFNIGSGIARTENDIVREIETELGLSLHINRKKKRNFDLPYAVLDVSRAERVLNWHPQTPINKSIRKIANSFDVVKFS